MLYVSVSSQHTFAQVNHRILPVATLEHHLVHLIALMGRLVTVIVALFTKYEYDVDFLCTDGICLESDVFLVESVIAQVIQFPGNALALAIQILHTELHSCLQLTVLDFVELQKLSYRGVLNDVVHIADKIGLAWVQQVRDINLLVLCLRHCIHTGPQITHIDQLHLQVFHRAACAQRIVDNWCLAYRTEHPVQPLRGIPA